MATNVEIANIAMTLLGEDTIISLTSDLGEKERKVNAIYNTTRDSVLRDYPWNFATTQTTLGLLSTAPRYDYDYAYQLPSDFIRMVGIEGNVEFKIVGDKLYTNSDNGNITYIKRETDPAKFDSLFVKAFAAKLAFELSYSLTNSNTLQGTMAAYYKELIIDAKRVDSQDETPDSLFNDELTDARLGTFSVNLD